MFETTDIYSCKATKPWKLEPGLKINKEDFALITRNDPFAIMKISNRILTLWYNPFN